MYYYLYDSISESTKKRFQNPDEVEKIRKSKAKFDKVKVVKKCIICNEPFDIWECYDKQNGVFVKFMNENSSTRKGLLCSNNRCKSIYRKEKNK